MPARKWILTISIVCALAAASLFIPVEWLPQMQAEHQIDDSLLIESVTFYPITLKSETTPFEIVSLQRDGVEYLDHCEKSTCRDILVGGYHFTVKTPQGRLIEGTRYLRDRHAWVTVPLGYFVEDSEIDIEGASIEGIIEGLTPDRGATWVRAQPIASPEFFHEVAVTKDGTFEFRSLLGPHRLDVFQEGQLVYTIPRLQDRKIHIDLNSPTE